ncbi:hypothetical protein KUTeg_004617 [Tegillarca granosa]|uniref:Uncharacterized protein n=1 Tax=Tegillarca granosa TaxID=220873 RepID=A0ABQ9FNJ8_TEGGR|nr:hypothetical protein KUTeg_004617 [Tegillarca granosa]
MLNFSYSTSCLIQATETRPQFTATVGSFCQQKKHISDSLSGNVQSNAPLPLVLPPHVYDHSLQLLLVSSLNEIPSSHSQPIVGKKIDFNQENINSISSVCSTDFFNTLFIQFSFVMGNVNLEVDTRVLQTFHSRTSLLVNVLSRDII